MKGLEIRQIPISSDYASRSEHNEFCLSKIEDRGRRVLKLTKTRTYKRGELFNQTVDNYCRDGKFKLLLITDESSDIPF